MVRIMVFGENVPIEILCTGQNGFWSNRKRGSRGGRNRGGNTGQTSTSGRQLLLVDLGIK